MVLFVPRWTPCFVASHPVPVVVSAVELLGLGLALDDRVHGLQVRGVSHQRQSDVPVGHAVDAPVVHAQVVLYVSGALTRKRTVDAVQPEGRGPGAGRPHDGDLPHRLLPV